MDFDHNLETITPDNQTTLTVGGTGSLLVPVGTTAQRPAGANGMVRFNSDLSALEHYNTSSWVTLGGGGGGGVSSITGTTNQVIVSPTTGAAVVSLANDTNIPGNPVILGSAMTFQDNGIGTSSGFIINRTNDYAGLYVTETSTNVTRFQFIMADDAVDEGAPGVYDSDSFELAYGGWQGPFRQWVPLVTNNGNIRLISQQLDIYGPQKVHNTPFFTGGGLNPQMYLVTASIPSNIKSSPGDISLGGNALFTDVTFNVSAYSGSNTMGLVVQLTASNTITWWVNPMFPNWISTSSTLTTASTVTGTSTFTTGTPVTLTGTNGVTVTMNVGFAATVGKTWGITVWPGISSSTDGPASFGQYVDMALYNPTASIPTPSTNNIRLFCNNVGGRMMLAQMGPSGLDTTLQPHMARNGWAQWKPAGTGTTISAIGAAALTVTGTATAATYATTSLHTRCARVDYLVTTAATTAVAGYRIATNAYRGQEGYHHIFRVAPATGGTVATRRFFCGMSSSTAAPTDVNPSTLTNIVGVGYDATDTNWQAFFNDASGTATKVNLGVARPSTDRSGPFSVAIFCPPGGASVSVTMTDETTGVKYYATSSTDLIPAATQVGPRAYHSVGGTSSVVGLTLFSGYMETDN